MQEKQAEQLYQELIDSYLASPHRKKVDVIQKAYITLPVALTRG